MTENRDAGASEASHGLSTSWRPKALFEPFRTGSIELANRIVMSPMTREFAPNGVLPSEAAGYYSRRAQGGAGLIVTEGTTVPHPVAHHTSTVPHMHGEAALAGWKRVVDAVHAVGGRIFPQLWHCGLGRIREETDNPEALSIGPSVVGKMPMRAMTLRDIDVVIDAFATAARSAQAIGFDGAAIHGGHGYLIDGFFWRRTNRRSDAYGGELRDRARFAAELVAEIRRRVGPDYLIMFRFSQWKGFHYDAKVAMTPAELEALLTPLSEAGVDIFDASTRRFWLPEFEGSALNLAGWAKKVTGKASMTVGSIGLEGPLDGLRVDEMSRTAVSQDNLQVLEGMLEREEVDLAGVGRILLANPRWGRLVAEGAYDKLRPYDPQRTAASLEPSWEVGVA